MILAERHIIKRNNSLYNELDSLCFLSKNLYNSALYVVRQHYFATRKYIPYVNVNNLFVKDKQVDYYALPSKVAQQTLKLVHNNWKSFFEALKAWKKDPSSINRPKPPQYKEKLSGRCVVTYTNQAISQKDLKQGFIRLSGTNVRIKTNVQNVQQVRVVPCIGYFSIEVIYKVDCKQLTTQQTKFCGVDLGLNNLMTCVFTDDKPLIFNGKPLKSINHFYNKRKAHLQSKLPNGIKTSKRINNLTIKRNRRVSDYLHKVSRMFVNHLVFNGITNVIVGYNEEWKQGINIGKKNNQNFANIPYLKLLNMLSYKCELEGISLATTEESYTSKCSFLDDEPIEKHDKYLGRRVKRGLFKTSNGRLLNADVNGALNILKKVIGKYEYNPISVCSTPVVIATTKRSFKNFQENS